jgi:hypothetical protein
MRSLLAAVSLLLLLPVAASAIPIEIELIGNAPESSTATLGADCTLRGTCGTQVIGRLTADMSGNLITRVAGNVWIDGLGSVDVLDGRFDLYGKSGSFLTTSLFGSFNFGQVSWSNGYFSFFGGNWTGGGCGDWVGCKLLWLRLRGRIEEVPPVRDIPEPSAALLFGAGAFIVSRQVSRRR